MRVNAAGNCGVKLPQIMDVFLILNGIVTDLVGVFVDNAVAEDVSQVDLIHKTSYRRAHNSVVAIGSKC